MSYMFTNATDALNFIMSGKAIFTIVSKKSGKRFTYRVEAKRASSRNNRPDAGFRFVRVMTGSDNQSSYTWLGLIRDLAFVHGQKSPIDVKDQSSVAIAWVLGQLVRGKLPQDQLEIWHEGRCGKCARLLTVPESIKNGIGPECAKTVYKCA